MESLASSSFYYDMGLDLSIFDQWEFAAFDDEFNSAQHKQYSGATIGYDVERSPSSEIYSSYAELRAQKTAKTSSWSSSAATTELNSAPLRDETASGLKILSFGHPDSTFHGNLSGAPEVIPKCGANSKRSYDAMLGPGPKIRSRKASNNQEHILAERKRREKLSQRFIALSAIVPGLKKMDKASVLGDAIKHLKQLQEKVRSLEDQVAKKSIESAVLLNKSHLSNDDDTSFTDEISNESHGESLPLIKARVCDKSILIKLQCENHKGALVRAISEIEKLHLSVVSTSVMAFSSSFLDITVMTQMDEKFSMTAIDLVKQLSSTCRQFK